MSIKTLTISAGILTLALLPALAQDAPKTLPEDEHKQLIENVCGTCHGMDLLDLVIADPRDKEAWSTTVERMTQQGASASDEEANQIVGYLAKYFGMPVNVNTADNEELKTIGLTEDQAKAVVAARAKAKFPDFTTFSALPALKDVNLEGVKHRLVFPKPLPQDPNRQTFLNTCSACHSTDVVVDENHSRESWTALVGKMRTRGALGSDDDFKKITDYLVKYFGPKTGSEAAK